MGRPRDAWRRRAALVAAAAFVLVFGGLVPLMARAATTTYIGPWAGGTILPADTVVLADGATVTGNVVANGTLQFAQTGSLTIGTTLSGTGTLSLANTGTLTLAKQVVAYSTTLLDMTVRVPQGVLLAGTNATHDLAMGVYRSSSLEIGGGVRNARAFIASTPSNYYELPSGKPVTVTVAGGTWANSGDVYLGSTGTGTLTMTGGLVSAASVRLASIFTGNWYGFPAGVVTVTGGTLAAAGDISLAPSGFGVGRLAVSGSGVVIVGGTLSRGTTGTLVLDRGGTLRIGSGGTGGVLAMDLENNGTLVFDRSGTYRHPATLTGSGGLVKAGPGTVSITGSNLLTGPTAVSAGTLGVTSRAGLAGGDAARWTAANLTVADGATLAVSVGGAGEFTAADVAQLAALGSGSSGFTNGSSIGLDTTGAVGGGFVAAMPLGNPNAGANSLGLTKLGSGTLTLSGSNTYTGPTIVNGGSVVLARRASLYEGASTAVAATRLSTGSGAVVAFAVGGIDGFTADDVQALVAAGTGTTGFMNGSSVGFDTTSAVGGTFVFPGTIADPNGGANSLGLVKLGEGTLLLTGSNGFTRGTVVEGGRLLLGNPRAVASGRPLTVAAGAFVLGAGSLEVGPLAGGSTAAIIADAAGVLTLTASSAAGTDFAGSLLDGAGTLALTKLGSGTLTLSGSNGYSGPTLLREGSLRLGGRTALYGGDATRWSAANITTGSGATLTLCVGGAGEFTAADIDLLASPAAGATGLQGGAVLGFDASRAAAGAFTYPGNLGNPSPSSAGLGVATFGSGTLVLSGSNGFTGGCLVAGGVLNVGSSRALGAAGLITFAGGTLQYSAANATDYSSRFSAAANQPYAIDTNGQTVVFATPLASVGGGLTKSGAGALTLTASNAYSAGTIVSGGTLSIVAGGDISHFAANMLVAGGDGGTATLAISGGRVENFFATIGDTPGSRGLATIVGGTWRSTGDLKVGDRGSGSMVVTDGLVESTGARLGESTGGVGGGTLTRARWNCRGWMYVGRSGSGSLEIASSTLATSNAYLGANAGGHGVVTVTDGTWAVDGALDVGGSGVGVLSLGRGAVTTRTTVIDGSLSTGSGLVTVTEGTLATGGSLTIGDSGAGSLVVTGGAVSGSTTVLGGFSSRANGAVTVTGGTFSTLGNLTVGSSGTGRLVVGSSGVVTVGGTLSRGSKGTIVIDPGGTLQVGMGGTGGALATNVATNGMLAFNLSGSSSASTVISGSGGFAKLGSGTLSLTGSNTYSGGTQILAGRLIGAVGTIRGPIANAAALTFAQTVDGTFASGLSGAGSLTKTGSGTLTIAVATSLSGPVTVQQGGLRLGDARAFASAPLTPLAGGVVSLAPRLQTTVGGLHPNAGGVIDVGDGAITVAGGLGTTALLAALGTGRGDGTWSGTAGIVSTVARADLARSVPRTVGWLDNGDGSQTIAYAAGGDSNLDWQVDILDAANFLAGAKFDTSSPASWNEGDFGYDGIVDILDAADFLSSGLFDAGGYNAANGVGMVAVPEPAVPGTMAVAVAGVWLAAHRVLRKRAFPTRIS